MLQNSFHLWTVYILNVDIILSKPYIKIKIIVLSCFKTFDIPDL